MTFLFLAGCSKSVVRSREKVSVSGDFDTVSYNYVFGEALRQKLMGNIGEAVRYFEQCTKINPGSDAAYYEIAQISTQRGDLQNGKIYGLKAYSNDKRNLWYITLLGDIYYHLKSVDSAVYYYEQAAKIFPERDEIKITLGNLYNEKGDFNKASETYTQLESKYGYGSDITVMAVRNLMAAGKIPEAEAKVDKILSKVPDNLLFTGIKAEIYRRRGDRKMAEETYNRLMNLDSTNIQTVLSMTDFLLEGKQYDDFFKLINDIVIDNQLSKEEYVTLFEKVLTYNDLLKDRSVQLEVIIRVLETNFPSDEAIQMIRPDMYEKINSPVMAANRLEELLVLFPDNYFYWEKILLLYSDIRNYDRLYTLGKECSEKFNLSYPAKVLFASAAMEKKEYQVALDELEKAKILAGNQDELISQVLSMEADVCYRKKEYVKSFELYREVLKKDPEDLIVLNNYAYFLAEQNQDLKEAERMIRIVMNKERDNGTYADTFAWILYKRGKYREAAGVLEELMKKNKTEDSEWFEHYGYIMKALKRCDAAVEYWKKALKLNGEKDYLNQDIENCTK